MTLYRDIDASLSFLHNLSMTNFSFLFMADCQLGAYATLSGMSEADILAFAERDMVVRMNPKVEGFAWDADRLERAVAEANRQKPAFVMIGGDMIDDLRDQDQLAAYERITGGLDPSIALHVAPGNHDVAFDATVPTEASVTAYRDRFGADHYMFSHGGTAFVVLNTTVLAQPQELPEEADRQLRAVERNLAKAGARGQETVVIGHHPLFLDTADEPDTYWNMPLATRLPLLQLFRRYEVRTMFAGHLHRNNIARDAGIEVVASGAVGYSLGHGPSGVRSVQVTDEGVEHEFVSLETSAGGEHV